MAQALRKLDDERQRFRHVLDQLPAYLVLLSRDYHVPFANRFFEERFGAAGGRRCYEYLFGRSEPCETCESFKPFETNAPHRWEWTGPDNHIYDIYDFPFTDVDGSRLVMEVGLDITERRKAEAELAQYRQHLEDVVRMRTVELEQANARLRAEAAERARAQEQTQRHADELQTANEELARFNRAAVDRELRMVELKRMVNSLCAQLSLPPRYALQLDQDERRNQP